MNGLTDQATEWLEGMGFAKADVENQETQMNAELDKDHEMRSRIARLFETDDGKEVLAWLVRATLHQPVIERHAVVEFSQEQVYAFALFREGENSVVSMVLGAIAQKREQDKIIADQKLAQGTATSEAKI